jgi:hypothetical protein
MSIKRERFWQYAKEAMLSASRAETERDKQDLLDLARTWAQAGSSRAALRSRSGYEDRRSGALSWRPHFIRLILKSK